MGFPNTGGSTPPADDVTTRPLAGDRLVEDGYQPINVIRTDENRLWGHSAVLNLDVCWEYGKLRWWDPAAGRYLETHEEEAEGRIAAEARIRELEAELRRRQNP